LEAEPDETLDAVLGGALRLYQPRRGYRFSLDPLLLADFVGQASGEVLELGAGCGVLALAVAQRSPDARVTAVELQPRLAELARRNAALNGLAAQVHIVEADLCRLDGVVPARGFELVVSNPPFQPASGRLSPSSEKALARHELACTLDDVVGAAARALRDNGRLALVYPAERLGEVMAALPAHGMAARRLRLVHPRADEGARLFLFEALRAKAATLEVLPPLALHVGAGRDFTAEAARILGERDRA